jgi:hypothetical protein
MAVLRDGGNFVRFCLAQGAEMKAYRHPQNATPARLKVTLEEFLNFETVLPTSAQMQIMSEHTLWTSTALALTHQPSAARMAPHLYGDDRNFCCVPDRRGRHVGRFRQHFRLNSPTRGGVGRSGRIVARRGAFHRRPGPLPSFCRPRLHRERSRSRSFDRSYSGVLPRSGRQARRPSP